MLISIENLLSVPVMSLQTGTQIAETTEAIIDPRQLTIAAFYVAEPGASRETHVLHPSDIREISDLGYIVDSDAKLMELDGLVRLEEIIDFKFELIGLKVVDENKRKLGKVSGYSVETGSFTIQQIYTEQSILRSFSSTGSTIHRSQVISVNNQQLVVSSPTVREDVKEAASETGQFVNPFRKGAQPEN